MSTNKRLSDEVAKITDEFSQLSFADFQNSAKKEDPKTIFMLGYCYEHGIDVEKDENMAFDYYKKAAENNSYGMYKVGHCYDLGVGVEKDKTQAFRWYQKSADKGNSNGMYQVGYCYDLGIGVEIDKNKAFENYMNSAKACNSKGFSKTAVLSNEMGRADGMLQIGNCYLCGFGTERDEHQAFIWYKKSAEKGNTFGNLMLGYCYEYGIGIEKDENKAFTYYQKLANMNDSNGMYQVGCCYYLGIGVEIDKHKAFTYYLKSAEAGNSMGIWKTAICYLYGIGVESNNHKWLEWDHKDPIDFHSSGISRYTKYGKCAHCNQDNTDKVWCLSCDPDRTTRWTSGNKDIDDCMKTFQLRTFAYEDSIEWIPFDRLSSVKEIGKGGFGSVYSATWLDGIRKVETIKDGDNNIYKRTREPSSIVALKNLPGSLKEFDIHMKCNTYGSKLKIYGLTQDSENRYLMIFQYANSGNLHKFLRTNFQELTWKTKLKILFDISRDLFQIHAAGYIHADFHSGNILHDQHISTNFTNLKSYITDLGLSQKHNIKGSIGEIYGVMPYVAPEVLSGEQQFTKAADIYGFGVIMSEISTGRRPFDGQQFDTKLAFKIICKGLRPEFASGTPKCYIELAKECMNSDPQKRPTADKIWNLLEQWNESMESFDDPDYFDDTNKEIKEQFLDADKIIKSLPISKHSDEMYTSKMIRTKLISEAIKVDLAQVNSTQINFDITKL